MTSGPIGAPVGLGGFASRLVDGRLINRHDLEVAEQHALRERLDLVDAVVALGFVRETDSYAALAETLATELVDLTQTEVSELAVRLVPERLARRHAIVPLAVDNRVITFATCRPFNPESERDLAFASGRRTKMVLATRTSVLDALQRCYPKSSASSTSSPSAFGPSGPTSKAPTSRVRAPRHNRRSSSSAIT
jgi:type IV pilus assembly protein PilB